MGRVLKSGTKTNITNILIKSLGKTLLEAILQAYDGIEEIEEKAARLPRYRGRHIETPSGKTQLKGRGLPEYAGQGFVQILDRLYRLQKKGSVAFHGLRR